MCNPLPLAGTYWQTAWVVCSHMLVSCLSLLNSQNSGALYPATLLPSYLGNSEQHMIVSSFTVTCSVLVISLVLAVRVAGGTAAGLKEAVTCGRGNKDRNLEVNAEQ